MLGPLTQLWSEAQAAQESDESLDPSTVLELVPVALRLLGNANHKLASQRRHVFLEHLDKGLTSMAEETYESAGTAQFGLNFLSRTQSKADSQEAMADVLKRFRDAHAPPKTKSAAPKCSEVGSQCFEGPGLPGTAAIQGSVPTTARTPLHLTPVSAATGRTGITRVALTQTPHGARSISPIQPRKA